MKPVTIIAVVSIAWAGLGVRAQDQNSDTNYVSKAEYQKLKDEHTALKQEMDTLKAQMLELLNRGAAPQNADLSKQVRELQKKVAAQQTESDQALDDMDKKIKEARQMAKDSFPGSTKMLLTGYGTA